MFYLSFVAMKLSKVNGNKDSYRLQRALDQAVSFQILYAVPNMQANLAYSC